MSENIIGIDDDASNDTDDRDFIVNEHQHRLSHHKEPIYFRRVEDDESRSNSSDISKSIDGITHAEITEFCERMKELISQFAVCEQHKRHLLKQVDILKRIIFHKDKLSDAFKTDILEKTIQREQGNELHVQQNELLQKELLDERTKCLELQSLLNISRENDKLQQIQKEEKLEEIQMLRLSLKRSSIKMTTMEAELNANKANKKGSIRAEGQQTRLILSLKVLCTMLIVGVLYIMTNSVDFNHFAFEVPEEEDPIPQIVSWDNLIIDDEDDLQIDDEDHLVVYDKRDDLIIELQTAIAMQKNKVQLLESVIGTKTKQHRRDDSKLRVIREQMDYQIDLKNKKITELLTEVENEKAHCYASSQSSVEPIEELAKKTVFDASSIFAILYCFCAAFAGHGLLKKPARNIKAIEHKA